MKKRIICVMAVLVVLGSQGNLFGARVLITDTPKAVQKAVSSYRDDVRRVDEFTYNGQKVYEVRVDTQGPDKLLYFSDKGSPMKDKAMALQRKTERSDLHLKDLPNSVKKTFKQHAGAGIKMDDIEMDTIDGRAVYDIQYLRGGRSENVLINSDGSIAQPHHKGLAQQDRTASPRSAEHHDVDHNRPEGQPVARFERDMSKTSKVAFDSVPDAVKRTARSVVGNNRVEDVDRGTLEGRTVYELAFKENKVHNEVRIAEDGSIVQRMITGYVTTTAGQVNVPATGKVTIDQVPAAVRRTIRSQIANDEVNDIDKMNVNGKTVYEVGFKRKGDTHQHEMLIAEDGTVVEAAGSRK